MGKGFPLHAKVRVGKKTNTFVLKTSNGATDATPLGSLSRADITNTATPSTSRNDAIIGSANSSLILDENVILSDEGGSVSGPNIPIGATVGKGTVSSQFELVDSNNNSIYLSNFSSPTTLDIWIGNFQRGVFSYTNTTNSVGSGGTLYITLNKLTYLGTTARDATSHLNGGPITNNVPLGMIFNGTGGSSTWAQIGAVPGNLTFNSCTFDASVDIAPGAIAPNSASTVTIN